MILVATILFDKSFCWLANTPQVQQNDNCNCTLINFITFCVYPIKEIWENAVDPLILALFVVIDHFPPVVQWVCKGCKC